MATLYVENVPDDLYEALRTHARGESRSIAAEVIITLKEKYPTKDVLAKRREWFEQLKQLHANHKDTGEKFPSAEEMIREDRER
jgi:plasmid stability protein